MPESPAKLADFNLTLKYYHRPETAGHTTVEDCLKAALITLKSPWVQAVSITDQAGCVLVDGIVLARAIKAFDAGAPLPAEVARVIPQSKATRLKSRYADFGL